MSKSGRRYERNSCFYLWIYREDFDPQMKAIPSSSTLQLPLSGKTYKVTLKNIKTYLNELLTVDDTISKVEIERASHVGSVERSSEKEKE